MELHENLYALGLRLGREVFTDPDSFRGALDDFLDEDSATTGDINLLVDAVRLGAFTSMTSMIDSGAQVTAAVEEAGSRLARDRGSADVAGAQWACAVLGFAIGKVSDAEVRRYRTQHATPPPPSQPLPPTQFPAQQPPPPTQQAQQPPPTQQPQPPQQPPAPPTQYPASGPLPTQQPQQQPQQQFAQAPPTSWPGGGGALPPEKPRKTWPILVATLVALVMIGGGIVALVVTRDSGGDDDNDNGPTDKKSEPVDDLAVDLDSIRERYSALAGDVTAPLDDDCEAGEATGGTSEVVTCTYADGTLELTTYTSQEELESARSANTGTDPGTRFSRNDAGVVYGVDSGSAVSSAEVSSIYWDSTDGLQSGMFTAGSGEVLIDDLAATYTDTQPPVDWPTKPEDPGMIELAEEFIGMGKCNRIQTIQTGETEESICTAPKGITIFMGVFKTGADFKAYRRDALQQGADQGYPLRNWNFGGGVREGAAAEYVNSSGSGVRYWDKPECKCYMEASLSGGEGALDTLENWWINA